MIKNNSLSLQLLTIGDGFVAYCDTFLKHRVPFLKWRFSVLKYWFTILKHWFTIVSPYETLCSSGRNFLGTVFWKTESLCIGFLLLRTSTHSM